MWEGEIKMSDETQTDVEEEKPIEPPYEDFFEAVHDSKDVCYLELGPEQMKDLVYYLYFILQPKINFDFDLEKVYRTLLYRNTVLTGYLLQEMKKALPEDHRLHRPINKIKYQIAEDIQEEWPTFRDFLEAYKKEAGLIDDLQ